MNEAPHFVRGAGAPVRALLIGAIKLYRLTLGSVLGGQCRFFPSCSFYGEQAIRTHGALKGSALAIWRVLRCHPFSRGGIDRVPAPRSPGHRHAGYDSIIQQRRRA